MASGIALSRPGFLAWLLLFLQLWGLSLAPTAALCQRAVESSGAVTPSSHRLLCKCRHCAGGPKCCCQSAHGLSLVLRPLCDASDPETGLITPPSIALAHRPSFSLAPFSLPVPTPLLSPLHVSERHLSDVLKAPPRPLS